MPPLSVVIPNWNGAELLPGCLEPLAGGAYEVIVIDNASTDSSREMIRERFPWVQLVQNSENRGFAVACNQGIDLAAGIVVLLLNNDTVPDPSALDRLAQFLVDHPRVGAAGPTLVNADRSRQRSCGPGPNLWTELAGRFLLHRVVPGVRTWAPRHDRRVDWVTGAALAAPTEVLRELGGLDEGMFMFYEDLDLCARIRESDREVWFVETAPVVHFHGATRRTVEAQSLVHSFRSTDRYFRRHGPAWRRRLLRWLTGPEMILRSMVWTALWMVPARRALARQRLYAYRTILGELRRHRS